MAFSGALTLTDLNDFISPSQACIKPVEQADKKPEEKYVGAKTEIVVDASGSYYEVSSGEVELNNTPSRLDNEPAAGTKLEQAQISLNDCLACSGCITSAESILITLQSHTEVFTFLEGNGQAAEDDKKLPVFSIAPQSLASLAAALTASISSSSSSSPEITPRQVLRRVRAFCSEALGVTQVFDTTFARHIALQEHIREFDERKAQDALGGDAALGQLPMLASACPGWICYAEKAHSEMLPFISKTKSPQQVMGTLVKEWIGKHRGLTPDKVYHVSVMPCYDKKLEASRQDFYNDIYSTRDVDCVITTGELELMMKEKGWDLSQPVHGELDANITTSANANADVDVRIPELIQHPGSSSGSYLASILDHVSQTSSVPTTLTSKLMRNADYEEFTLSETESGKVIFKGAKCYGFRNLQNVVRKVGKERGVRTAGGAAGKLAGRAGAGVGRRMLKKTTTNTAGAAGGDKGDGGRDKGYDYVEVMACPGGCVNGGGQLKPVLFKASTGESSKSSSSSRLDEEGYPRDWEQNGIIVPDSATAREGGVELLGSAVGGIESGVVTNAKWGDKDWTRKVESAYWLNDGGDLAGEDDEKRRRSEEGDEEGSGSGNAAAIKVEEQAPHDQPVLSGTMRQTSGGQNGAVDVPGGIGGGREGASEGQVAHRQRSGRQSPKLRLADDLAARVLKELCGGGDGLASNRHRFFRTDYHAVESEVIGLAVKW